MVALQEVYLLVLFFMLRILDYNYITSVDSLDVIDSLTTLCVRCFGWNLGISVCCVFLTFFFNAGAWRATVLSLLQGYSPTWSTCTWLKFYTKLQVNELTQFLVIRRYLGDNNLTSIPSAIFSHSHLSVLCVLFVVYCC